MKAKLKTIEIILLSMVVILDAYLIHLSVAVGKFEASKENSSTAYYMEVKEKPVESSLNNVVIEEEKEEESIDIQEEVVEENPIVYDGKTLNELSETLEKSLNSTISGKGYLIASYSLEKEVDPYMATAIILQETGCKWQCSYLVRECNNVGGQKGQGCGSYSYFPSLDEGIKAFIDNLYKNYISYGLTTPETINPKYAADPNWSVNVNKYIESIKAQ